MDYQQPVIRKKTNWGRIIINVLFIFSIIANIILFFAVAIMGVMIAGKGRINLMEETLLSGPATTKIAVINLEGVINPDTELAVKDQILSAQRDPAVKAMILKISSPGGMVSSSDNIHHYITRYKENTGKPVICYMDGLAASGGYYAAVACDKIIASPTTITGSIGVIMGHMDISQLMQEKLGITPSTIKSGEKKDWPSMFRELSQREKIYLNNKIIEPAYQRFVELIDNGRENLDMDQILNLADGSIYFANEAKEFGLIDDTGYFEVAIDAALEMSGLQKARLIQYQKPFSFSDILQAKNDSILNFSNSSIHEMLTPKLMYLWDGKN